MSAEPAGSIKGSGFESAVADVLNLVQEGRIAQAELRTRLTETDRGYLQNMVMPSLWYPLESYERLVALLLEKEGRGETAYLVERGRKAAERLYKAGVYRQLDATIDRWGELFGSFMASFGAALFSDTNWTLHRVETGGESDYRVEVDVPAGFPECARFSSQGFIEYMGARVRGDETPVRCVSHRPRPTLLVYEISPR